MVRITLDTLQRIRKALSVVPKGENISEGEIVEGEILRGVFRLVQDKEDWKGEIDATIDPLLLSCDEGVIAQAVSYMTATEPEITHVTIKGRPMQRVRSAGYRMGPAGP